MTRETLKNLDLISQVTQQSIADIDIIVPTTKNPKFKGAVFDIVIGFGLD
jgi:hypothetical protein